jgi:predicted RNase H-like HicB family nuclease
MAKSRGTNGNSNSSQRTATFVKADRALDLSLEFRTEGDSHLARCVELGTSSFGDTPVEAEEAILEAIALHLDALDEHGELKRFLAENGVQIRKYEPAWSFAGELVPA